MSKDDSQKRDVSLQAGKDVYLQEGRLQKGGVNNPPKAPRPVIIAAGQRPPASEASQHPGTPASTHTTPPSAQQPPDPES